MKLLRHLIACIVAISAAHAGEPANVAAPFTLTVIPSRSSPAGQSISIADDLPEEFYVVLTNASKDAQAVFQKHNSWGYQNVSFEFTMTDGKKAVASKRGQIFTVNFPGTFLIPVGEHQVYAIRLNKEWETKPALAAAAETPIALKAIYEVKIPPRSNGTQSVVGTCGIETLQLHTPPSGSEVIAPPP